MKLDRQTQLRAKALFSNVDPEVLNILDNIPTVKMVSMNIVGILMIVINIIIIISTIIAMTVRTILNIYIKNILRIRLR